MCGRARVRHGTCESDTPVRPGFDFDSDFPIHALQAPRLRPAFPQRWQPDESAKRTTSVVP